jgi:hypothetical protein
VAAVSWVPRARSAEVWSVPVKDGKPAKLGTVPRAPETPVTATAVPGTALVGVVVSPRRERDPTWSGALYFVGAGRAPRLTARDVHAGGRPASGAEGEVFVVRGAAGAERAAADASAGYRHDTLEVIAVDARSGALRSVYRTSGDALFLIGLVDHELVAYAVGAGSAPPTQGPAKGAPGEIIAIDVAAGRARPVLAPAPALARDFSLDAAGKRVLFTALRAGAAANASDRWGVYELDVTKGAASVVATGPSMALTPSPWPGGAVVYACPSAKGAGGAQGLCLAGPGTGAAKGTGLQPMGGGRAEIADVVCSDGRAVALGVEEKGGPFPVPFRWDIAEVRARALDLPSGRVLFAGALAPAAAPQAP